MNSKRTDPNILQRWRMNQIASKMEREISAIESRPSDDLASLERKVAKIFRIGSVHQELIFVVIDSELYLPILYSMLASVSGERPIVVDLAVLGELLQRQERDIARGISKASYDAKYAMAPSLVETLEQDLSRSVLIDAYAPDAEDDNVVGSQYLALNHMRDTATLGGRRGPGVVLMAIAAKDLREIPGDLYSHRLSTVVLGEGEPSARTNIAADVPLP